MKRLVIALTLPAPWEGILDAYVVESALVVVLGDMSVREFPIDRLPRVRGFEAAVVGRFVIDSAGSYPVLARPGPGQMAGIWRVKPLRL